MMLALLVVAYWRTNLTLRQLAPLFGISKSAAGRIIDDLGPKLALRPRQHFAPGTVLIVDGTLVPMRDRSIAAPSKKYRYSANHQVVVDADSQFVIGDGGYIATSAIIPHRRRPGQDLPWKTEHNASHRKVRARVEHAFARMKAWKILRDCRLRGNGVADAMLGIARLRSQGLSSKPRSEPPHTWTPRNQ